MTGQHTAQDSEEDLRADIETFATYDRKGGWALALLVARRVEPGEGDGVRLDYQPRCFDRNTFRRISAREFARRSGTTAKRVLAFFQAWERAADDKIVPKAHELTPGIHVDLPDAADTPFFGEGGYYRSNDARSLAPERRTAIEQEELRGGAKATTTAYVLQHPAALKSAVLADATARAAAKAAIEEFDRRQAQADQQERAAARQVSAQREAEQDDAEERERALEAVRASRGADSDFDAAFEVFNELTQVRLRTLRALTLLQQHQVTYSEQRAATIGELCDSASAALEFIRDLATSSRTALNDEALRAFMEESERL
jgi:hypothetical protein